MAVVSQVDDISGNSNHSPAVNLEDSNFTRTGPLGSGQGSAMMNLNGSDETLRVDEDNNWLPTTAVTICCRFNAAVRGGYMFGARGSAGANGAAITVYWNTSYSQDRLAFVINDTTVITGDILATDTDYSVVATYDKVSQIIYLDGLSVALGVLQTSNISYRAGGAGSNMHHWGCWKGNSLFFNGGLSDLRIYGGGFTAGEASDYHNGTYKSGAIQLLDIDSLAPAAAGGGGQGKLGTKIGMGI